MSHLAPPEDWRLNYFNYFTEVEERFQQARGTGLFLMSPLDWALIENWKSAGIPLAAVLRGIDEAFTKYRAKPRRGQLVNSLAYCTQAVMDAAKQMADQNPNVSPPPEESNPFTAPAIRAHLEKARAAVLASAGFEEIGAALQKLLESVEEHAAHPQELDQRLSALEDKMASLARTRLSDDQLFEARRDFDHQLGRYRGKMSTEQLAMLERKFLDRKVFELAKLPRLSLFYLEPSA